MHFRQPQIAQPQSKQDNFAHPNQGTDDLLARVAASTRGPQASLVDAITDSKSQEYPITHHHQLRDREVFDQHLGDPILAGKHQHGEQAQENAELGPGYIVSRCRTVQLITHRPFHLKETAAS
ncbi:hypothetical protein D3C84_961770 [compost metagenome]